jgi:capsular polysaccharide biosynthesis protein
MTELKRLLAARLGPQEGFARWRALIPPEKFPNAEHVEPRPLRSLRVAAEQAPVFVDIAPSGQAFEISPPKIIGAGDNRTLRNKSRALYVTCLSDARIRSGSALVATSDAALFDFEEWELARVHQIGFRSSMVDFDPSLFYCDADRIAWILVPAKGLSELKLETAFSLFGLTAAEFGHWFMEYLPRYVMASMMGSLPPVPILVNQWMPTSHRQSLELLVLDGAEIVERPRYTTAHVRKLWLSSKHNSPPIYEGAQWDYFAHNPARFALVLTEMARRLDRTVPTGRGPEKVYLARKAHLRRSLLNAAAIEEVVRRRGFAISYPEDFSFAEQFRLVRDARFVVGPEGSAMFLCMLCRPGTKVAILNHTHTENVVITSGLMTAVGLDVTVVTGPIVAENERFVHFSDYEIDIGQFSNFLNDWVHTPSLGSRCDTTPA